MAMITLTDEEAGALEAFCESFDLLTTGAWAPIEAHMRDAHAIPDPETALENARRALRGEVI
jgi:hypothetical protein